MELAALAVFLSVINGISPWIVYCFVTVSDLIHYSNFPKAERLWDNFFFLEIRNREKVCPLL